jgi:Tol biopolymer transport system component
MFRTALVTTLLTAVVVTIGSGSASGAFPGVDGKIAFVNDRNGTPSIFTTDADGKNVERLVPNTPQGEFTSSSPDGKTMLFSVRVSTKPTPSYELWTMKADGTNVRRFLSETSSRPYASAWSPNGRSFAYYGNSGLWVENANRTGARRIADADFSGGAPSWSNRGQIAFDRAGRIWVVSPKTGKERLVGPGSQPSWSPDGRRLVFVAVPKAGANSDIFVMRASGRGRTRLTATPRINETQPAWSSGGRWIAYTGQEGVYAMRSHGKMARLVAAKGLQPSWVKGERGLVFTRRTSRWNGFVLRTDLNGKHTRWLLRPRLDASPTWSPDGTQLAFTRDGAVFLEDADGGVLRSTGLKGSDPAWSPDGEHIVVALGLDLVIANADGSEPTSLGLTLDSAKFTRVSEPDWSVNKANPSSNLSSIAFVATNTSGIKSIFVVELKANTLEPKSSSLEQLPLGCDTIGASSPSWSPSGSRIAFACDQSIALADSDGSNLGSLGSAENATLAWAPDGSQIAFSEQPGDQPAQLFVMNSDGTVPSKLDVGPGSSDQPDWQPLP